MTAKISEDDKKLPSEDPSKPSEEKVVQSPEEISIDLSWKAISLNPYFEGIEVYGIFMNAWQGV